MNKDVLFGWLDQSKIDYVELKEPLGIQAR